MLLFSWTDRITDRQTDETDRQNKTDRQTDRIRQIDRQTRHYEILVFNNL